MLSIQEATNKISSLETVSAVEAVVQYKSLYVVRVRLMAKGEEVYDPFFSVNVNTGEVKEFSVLHDGDLKELTYLFLRAE